MNRFNVFMMMVFEAESKEEAEEKAYNAMSLIPKGECPEHYESQEVCKDLSAE